MRAARSWPLTLSAANCPSKIRATVMGARAGHGDCTFGPRRWERKGR